MSIDLKFTGDVADLIRGVETGEKSLDDLKDSLGQVGESAVESSEEASEAMEDLGTGAEMSGRQVRSVGRIAKEALEGDLAGAVQAATPLLMSLGPVGVVAGSVAAVGIGAITAGVDAAGKASEEMVKKLTTAYQRAAEEGRAYLDEAQIMALAAETIFDPEKRENARKEAERIGVDLQTYIRGQSGDQEALNEVLERTNALLAEQEEIRGSTINMSRDLDYTETQYRLEAILGENQAIHDATLENIAAAEIYQQVVAEGATAAGLVADRIDSIPRDVSTRVTLQPDTSALDRELAKPRKVLVSVGARGGQAII